MFFYQSILYALHKRWNIKFSYQNLKNHWKLKETLSLFVFSYSTILVCLKPEKNLSQKTFLSWASHTEAYKEWNFYFEWMLNLNDWRQKLCCPGIQNVKLLNDNWKVKASPNFYEVIVGNICMENGVLVRWGYGVIKRNYGRLKTSRLLQKYRTLWCVIYTTSCWLPYLDFDISLIFKWGSCLPGTCKPCWKQSKG